MRCVLMDDDITFSELVIQEIVKRFPKLKGQIDLISTEKEFRSRLEQPGSFRYDLAILDLMVHWVEQDKVELVDPRLTKGGYFRAGVRCLVELRKCPETAAIPVIIHSAVDKDEVSDAVESALSPEHLSTENLEIFEKRGNAVELLSAIDLLLFHKHNAAAH